MLGILDILYRVDNDAEENGVVNYVLVLLQQSAQDERVVTRATRLLNQGSSFVHQNAISLLAGVAETSEAAFESILQAITFGQRHANSSSGEPAVFEFQRAINAVPTSRLLQERPRTLLLGILGAECSPCTRDIITSRFVKRV